MLHRLPSSAVLPLSRRESRHGASARLPTSPAACRWLTAAGSLTARLRRHGAVKVQVLRQGRHRLWPQEQAAIHTRFGHVREVVLTINGRPAVWARSVTSSRGLKGPWHALTGLGTRPLAELLFEHRGVKRDPLRSTRLTRHGVAHAHLTRQWQHLTWPNATEAAPSWARRSVFWHKGQPLQVMECFAPWVLSLSTGRR